MIPGINTHIEAWVDPQELAFLYSVGFRMARIAAHECTDATTVEMVRDAKAAGFSVIVTLTDPKRIRLVAPLFTEGDLVECRNEDDGDWWAMYRGLSLWPWVYREILNEFCRIGLELGVPIGGPTCSNTNEKCFKWARAVRGEGWPAGMTHLTWHSYDPHENTWFKEMEALSDGLPIIISEFGYPSLPPITEDEQAEKARELWPQYAKYHAAIWYQIHDGEPNGANDQHFGVRAYNEDRWKPVAYTVPTPDQELEMANTEIVIYDECLIPLDSYGKPGKYSAYTNPNKTHVIAMDEKGNVYANPLENIGRGFETFSLSTDRLVGVFDETGSALHRGLPVRKFNAVA